jgi:hypothetical protein
MCVVTIVGMILLLADFGPCWTIQVSHLTWNPPRQHAAAARNELVNAEQLQHASKLVSSYVGHSVFMTTCLLLQVSRYF